MIVSHRVQQIGASATAEAAVIAHAPQNILNRPRVINLRAGKIFPLGLPQHFRTPLPAVLQTATFDLASGRSTLKCSAEYAVTLTAVARGRP
ncbi:hypothetical protein E1287_42370 [Actinomadura sp. KC06]|nr:hypothetical protein E1287_42370 [Actinomadura sp. KC06]